MRANASFLSRAALALALGIGFSDLPATAQDFPVDPDAPVLQVPPEPRPEAPPPPPRPRPAPPPPPIDIGPPEPLAADGPPELLAAGDPASPTFVGAPEMPPFRIFNDEVLPGARARLEWNASQSFAGDAVVSPVTVVHGTRPGPVLCLTAAVHGDEINGVEIVRRVVNGIDPKELSGTVIAVPIVNLFGFSRNSRYLPDRRDLNRFFPGSRYGSVAARIAYSFFSGVVRHCRGGLVDFHTGSFDRSNLPQVRGDLTIPAVLELTRGFGATPVLHSDGSRGMLRTAATAAGIPAVTFEVGAPARLQPEEIEVGHRAIETLLHKLGMTRNPPVSEEPQPIFYESVWVRVDAGGMMISDVDLGQRVTRGQRLGRVIDPIQNIEREVISPVFGRVIGMALNQVVLPGFAAYHLGEETSEERAVLEAVTSPQSPVEEDPDPGEREGSPDDEV